jgi:DNA gyrase/topoisomerase IV subunit B
MSLGVRCHQRMAQIAVIVKSLDARGFRAAVTQTTSNFFNKNCLQRKRVSNLAKLNVAANLMTMRRTKFRAQTLKMKNKFKILSYHLKKYLEHCVYNKNTRILTKEI